MNSGKGKIFSKRTFSADCTLTLENTIVDRYRALKCNALFFPEFLEKILRKNFQMHEFVISKCLGNLAKVSNLRKVSE